MKLRILLITCSFLISTGSIVGQSVAPTTDSVTGTWKGYMGPGVSPQFAITLNLKLDKAAVSGTLQGLPSPGDVKQGTFDSNTGAINLQLGITGQSVVRLVLEGTIVNGTATGRVTGDNQTGTFMIAKVPADAPSAQQAGSPNVVADLRRSFGEVSAWVTKAADMVPAEKYSYRPVDTVRTFGQLIAHVADSYNYYCARAAGKNIEWSDPLEKGSTDKATLVPKLKQALDTCNVVYGGNAGQPGQLIDNVGHTSLHYGNIITYMRMLGMKPPSS
jgi:hypothetical protein